MVTPECFLGAQNAEKGNVKKEIVPKFSETILPNTVNTGDSHRLLQKTRRFAKVF